MSDIDLRFGSSQTKTAELAHLILQFISVGSNADDEWSKLYDAVNAYSDLLPDLMTIVKAARPNIDYGTTRGHVNPLLIV